MKKAIRLLSVLLIMISISTISGCKDPCKDAVCLNGATCDDGVCDCALGYTGEHCGTEVDPCTQVTCEADQVCENGNCFDLPTANFTFVGNGCTAACSILFSNTSTEATSYSWDFGDGSTSSSSSPTHEYLLGNTYTVILTATNQYGSDSHSEEILIQANTSQQLPSASFSMSNNGCTATCSVNFNNNSSNATSYSWNFGDGASSSSSSPSHSYSSGGSYTVTLTATNQYGSDDYQQTVTIDNPPTSATITNVQITDCPLDNGGDWWDAFPSNTDADIYFDLETSGGTVVLSAESSAIDNVGSLPISWNITNGYQINNLSQGYRIVLWDDDTNADDYMGQTNQFSFSSYPTYPSVITVNGNGVTIKLTVTWQ